MMPWRSGLFIPPTCGLGTFGPFSGLQVFKPPTGGGGGGGGIAKVFDTSKQGTSGGCVTPAVDTTGANLIVISAHYYTTIPSLSDSKGNTWTPLTSKGSSGTGVRMYYCLSPSVGSGHTFTLSGGDGTQYLAVQVIGFSGVTAFDAESAGASVGNASAGIQPGSLTPAQSGEVFVCATSFQVGAWTLSIDSSFTELNEGQTEGATTRDTINYKIKSDAAAENPKVSPTSGTPGASIVMAAFK